tara:strand:- start:1533 stop:1955 length:423 start_codon:yes stop_codon:yes gene_type:complete
MVTFRNNNTKRNNFRRNGRNDRSFKSNNDRGKYSSNFSNNENFQRKIPGRNNHNAPKLIEKYNNLAREALSAGDKILSENYFQHADHFTRILSEQEVLKKTKYSVAAESIKETSENTDKEEKNVSDTESNKSENIQSEVN